MTQNASIGRSGLAASLAVAALLASTAVVAAQTSQPATAPAATPVTVKLDFSADVANPQSKRGTGLGYTPTPLRTVAEKPPTVRIEPTYVGTPKYGIIRLGNGSKSDTLVVIDEGDLPPGKIYVDRNQNGDLTDDGDGAWTKATERDGKMSYTLDNVPVHVSYGSPVEETSGGESMMLIYRQHGGTFTGYAQWGTRTGTLEIDGTNYPIALRAYEPDGLFIVTARHNRSRRPMELLVDVDGDGTFQGAKKTTDGKEVRVPERFSLSQPFQLGGKWWLAAPTLSGDELTLSPTTPDAAAIAAAAAAQQPPPERKPLIAEGKVAPDFTAIRPDGTQIKLSDLRGKLVILDFWATWCGPCKVSMPGLEKTYASIRDQNVEVLSVCVWDDKPLFDKWVADGGDGKKYSFTWCFDPAGKDAAKGIASSMFGVSGIPTMFVIDREGKIVKGIVGSGQEAVMKETLKAQGIKITEG